MLVESIMIKQIVTISPDTSLQEALDTAHKHRVRHLPVVQGDYLIGLISDRDLRDAAPSTLGADRQEDLLATTAVRHVMVHEVVTAHPLDFVEDAAQSMFKHRVGCLPVVSNGQLVGIITERDILHTLVKMMGVDMPTSRVEVDVPDKPGILAEVCDFLRARRINASSVWVYPSRKEGHKTIIFRIRTMDPRRFEQDITAAGFELVQPPAQWHEGEGEV